MDPRRAPPDSHFPCIVLSYIVQNSLLLPLYRAPPCFSGIVASRLCISGFPLIHPPSNYYSQPKVVSLRQRFYSPVQTSGLPTPILACITNAARFISHPKPRVLPGIGLEPVPPHFRVSLLPSSCPCLLFMAFVETVVTPQVMFLCPLQPPLGPFVYQPPVNTTKNSIIIQNPYKPIWLYTTPHGKIYDISKSNSMNRIPH